MGYVAETTTSLLNVNYYANFQVLWAVNLLRKHIYIIKHEYLFRGHNVVRIKAKSKSVPLQVAFEQIWTADSWHKL